MLTKIPNSLHIRILPRPTCPVGFRNSLRYRAIHEETYESRQAHRETGFRPNREAGGSAVSTPICLGGRQQLGSNVGIHTKRGGKAPYFSAGPSSLSRCHSSRPARDTYRQSPCAADFA